MVSVLSVCATARFMFRTAFSFLLCPAVFFRFFRHVYAPFITAFTFNMVCTTFFMRGNDYRMRIFPSRLQQKMAFNSPPNTIIIPDK